MVDFRDFPDTWHCKCLTPSCFCLKAKNLYFIKKTIIWLVVSTPVKIWKSTAMIIPNWFSEIRHLPNYINRPLSRMFPHFAPVFLGISAFFSGAFPVVFRPRPPPPAAPRQWSPRAAPGRSGPRSSGRSGRRCPGSAPGVEVLYHIINAIYMVYYHQCYPWYI